jgi:acid phosphatase
MTPHARAGAALAAVALLATATACGTGVRATTAGRGPTGSRADADRATATTATTATTASVGRITKLLVIVEENHSRRVALASMPYLRKLAGRYGQATHYVAVTHPSLPNYLAITGGSTFGVTDDAWPSSHRIRGRSVFGQALAAHRSARVYAQSQPLRCDHVDSGRYAVRHTGWPYFASETTACKLRQVAAGMPSGGNLATATASGHLPNVGLVVPNLCYDAHDCSLATADGWLSRWIPVLRSGPDYRAGRLAIVVTFDEGSATDNNVAFVVVSPYVHSVVATRHLTHYSLTRAVDAVLGVPPLRKAALAPAMPAAFHLAG